MTQSPVPITLRLLRKNCTSKSEDDVITIFRETNDYKDDNESFKVRYVDGLADVKHEMYLSGDELDVYFDSLFSLMSADTEPFESLQVLAPGFPSVLFNASRVNMVKDHLLSVLPLLTDVRRIPRLSDYATY
jgi:hypothetical protein